MNKYQFYRRFVWLLATLLICGVIASLTVVTSLAAPTIITPATVTAALAKVNIIYLGEKHDRLVDRQAQLEIIKSLYQSDEKIAIALEMFQRPYQPVIDDYLMGKITEAQLRENTEFDKRWGFDWESYAPIFRFAKAHKLPLIALNVPSEITRKVSRQGLESLTESEKKLIPPLSEIRTDSPEYRQMVQEIYEQHAHAGQGNSKNFERFFTAQVLWDETMAETVATFYRTNPASKIIVIAGEFHIIYGYGIPSRVARRLSDFPLKQRSILLSKPETFSLNKERLPADFFFKWEQNLTN